MGCSPPQFNLVPGIIPHRRPHGNCWLGPGEFHVGQRPEAAGGSTPPHDTVDNREDIATQGGVVSNFKDLQGASCLVSLPQARVPTQNTSVFTDLPETIDPTEGTDSLNVESKQYGVSLVP